MEGRSAEAEKGQFHTDRRERRQGLSYCLILKAAKRADLDL